MNPDEAALSQEAPAVAAPRRAVRLVAKPLLSDEERLAARQERQERQLAEAQAAKRSVLEKKLAGMHDAHDMLRVVEAELTMRRAKRLTGEDGNTRQTLRVLSIAVLFAALIAGLGAMFWLQDRLARTGISRHREEIKSQK